MKKMIGLSDMVPARYAAGGLATNDELPKAQFNPSATFTGSPAGTGLTAPAGGFTAATAKAGGMDIGHKSPGAPSVVGGAVAPTTYETALNNTRMAFLGGPVAQPAVQAPIDGTPVPKWPASTTTPASTGPDTTTVPAAKPLPTTAPVTTTPGGGAANQAKAAGFTAPQKSATVALPPKMVDPYRAVAPAYPIMDDDPNMAPPPPGLSTVAALDASQDTTKYGLPTGETVGYGGKLNNDVAQAYKAQFGRAPDAAGQDYWRTQLANGLGLSDMDKQFDASAEGQEFNLTTDPLDDAQFATRAYRAVFGRDPDEGGKAWLTNMLRQGYSRKDALKMLAESPEFKQSGKTLDQGAVDSLIGQGDKFKVELKDDDTEKVAAQQFKGIMGRDPTDYEIAKYADAIRSGFLTLEPGDKSLQAAITARKAAGWAKGGRVRKWKGGPVDEPIGLREGGRVTARDRFIDEQAADKKEEPRHEAAESARTERKEDRAELDAADKALLEKYRRKSLGERIAGGLSSLMK